MNRKDFIFVVVGFLACSTLLIQTVIGKSDLTATTNGITDNESIIIIDAGHGGFDGGASSGKIDEKDINLDIALKLQKKFEDNGFKTIMTRESDISTASDEKDRNVSQKKSDMRNRLSMLNANTNNIFISIHQNKFSDSSSSGSQVFYGTKNQESSILAKNIQDTMKDILKQTNNRVEVPAKNNLFLLWNAKVPAIIVECGFMSNAEELKNLQTDEFQEDVAFAIFNGTLNFLNSSNESEEVK